MLVGEAVRVFVLLFVRVLVIDEGRLVIPLLPRVADRVLLLVFDRVRFSVVTDHGSSAVVPIDLVLDFVRDLVRTLVGDVEVSSVVVVTPRALVLVLVLVLLPPLVMEVAL